MATASDGGENGTTAYADTSVVVAVSIEEDMHHNDAIRVISAAVRNKCRLIVSHLVILEAIGAVRKKFITSYRHRSGSKEEKAGAEALAEEAVSRVIKFIAKMATHGLWEIVELEGWSPNLPHLCDKALAHRGIAVHSGNAKTYRYRGIGPFDLMHYALARDAGASVIITSDVAFADVEGNDDEFGHIRVQLTGEPLIDLLGGDDTGQGEDRGVG